MAEPEDPRGRRKESAVRSDWNTDWLHEAPASVFVTENDLDANYIPKYQQPGETKDAVLNRVTLSFRQGVLVPGAPVFDAFARLLGAMGAGGIAGFAPLASLDEVGHFARARMEFLKRLCDSSYGIYAANVPVTVGGVVYVYGVGRKGEIRKYKKGKNQIESVRSGRP